MRKHVKKGRIVFITVMLMAFMLIPVQAKAYSAESLQSAFNRIKNTSGYVNGTKYVWNDDGFFSDYCNGGTGWGVAHTGWQCFAYGLDIFGQLFQQCPMDHKNYSINVNNLYVGDVIRLYWDDDSYHGGDHPWGHTIIVTDIVGDTVYYTDANSDGNGTVTWGRSYQKSYIASWAKYFCHADGNSVKTLTNVSNSIKWTSSVSNITDTNANVSAKITLSSSVQFQWVGCNFFDANGNMVAQAGQTTTANGNSLDISYNITNNTSNRYSLKPGTTYQYQFYATYGGTDHFSPMYSFKTTHQHSYVSSITKNATCTETGKRKYKCSICSYSYETTIPAAGHSSTSEIRNVKEATCVQAGYTGDGYCKNCGVKVRSGEVVQPTGVHNWNSVYTVDKEPADTEEGSKSIHCKVCGASKPGSAVAIPMTGTGTEQPNKPSGTGSTAQPSKPSEAGGTAQPNKPSETEKPVQNNSTVKVSPAAGTLIADNSTGAIFSVTKSGSNGTATVKYMMPANKKLSAVSIPDTVTAEGVVCKVTSISSKAFQGNKYLKTVKIGKNVVTIGNNAFYGCKNLRTVSGGASLKVIGKKAFSKCVRLTKITIPAQVTTIGKQAFYGCKGLKKITIKTSRLTTKSVGSKAFKGTPGNVTVRVPGSKLNAYKKLLKSKGISKRAKIKR